MKLNLCFYLEFKIFVFEMSFSLIYFLILSLLSIIDIAFAQPSVTELSLSPTSYIAAARSLEDGTLKMGFRLSLVEGEFRQKGTFTIRTMFSSPI